MGAGESEEREGRVGRFERHAQAAGDGLWVARQWGPCLARGFSLATHFATRPALCLFRSLAFWLGSRRPGQQRVAGGLRIVLLQAAVTGAQCVQDTPFTNAAYQQSRQMQCPVLCLSSCRDETVMQAARYECQPAQPRLANDHTGPDRSGRRPTQPSSRIRGMHSESSLVMHQCAVGSCRQGRSPSPWSLCCFGESKELRHSFAKAAGRRSTSSLRGFWDPALSNFVSANHYPLQPLAVVLEYRPANSCRMAVS